MRRFFDWKFCVAFAFMLLVAYFVYAGIASVRRNDELVRLVKDQRDTSALARKDATRQRVALIVTQRQLVRQLGHLQHKQDALLAYLRDNGIEVPADLPDTRRSSTSGRPSSTGSGGNASPSPSHHAGGTSSTPATPVDPSKPSTPTPTPQPSQPDPEPGICVLIVCLG